MPLFNPGSSPVGQSNTSFLRDHISNLLAQSFPNLKQTDISVFVNGLFDLKVDLPTFKIHLRDFLIQLKEFGAEDNSGLYGEEQDAKKQQQIEAHQAHLDAVPGLLKPSEIIDTDLGDV